VHVLTDVDISSCYGY